MNRETWLNKATKLLSKRFVQAGLPAVPADVKVSCGFPGGGSPRKRIGECWPRALSSAGVNEIFINPTQSDKTQVLAILAHELAHAIDDCKSGHNAPFVKLVRGIGLEGKPTATYAGPEFTAWAEALSLPDFPHGALRPARAKADRSGVRVKLTCEVSGHNYWMSKAAFQEQLYCPFCGGDHGECN